MISSLLQNRFRQFSTTAAAPPSQTSPSPARPDALSTPRRTESRNTALRTIGGASLFEASSGKTGAKAGPLRVEPGPAGGITKVDPAVLREQPVERAIAARGRPVDFVNSDGKTEQVSIAQLPPPFQDNTYAVRVGEESFTVQFQGGTTADREAFLAQVIDSYSETPPELRGALDKVVVTPDAGPTTATGAGAAATAGDGTITFYDDGQHLSEGIFHHELAHLIGRQQEDKDDSLWTDITEAIRGEPPPIPNGWEEAAQADGNFTSDYAETDFNRDGNYTEDFADAWRAYMTAIDDGPKALAAFKAQFPERAEILEDLYSPPEAD